MALMNSFYGGRRGASFVIVKNYLDVLSMVTDFSRGNEFTEVKFDEYVIINNPNKNHPDNGKIFRRGYDYNSDRTLSAITLLVDDENGNYYQEVTQEKYKNLKATDKFVTVEKYISDYDTSFTGIQAHGAEYIGCIVGPAGKAPLLNMESYEATDARSANGFEYRKTSGTYSPDSTNPGIIPGKDEEGNFHDNIEWVCFSIRNDQYGDDTQAYIGFKFPYLVTQMQTSQVEPYDTNGDIADMSNISRVLGVNETINTHPYYNKWHLNIPKGVKGDTFKNLKVTTYSAWLSSLSSSADRVMYDTTQGQSAVYQPPQDEINKAIIIYEDWNYDNKQAGEVKYYYLGDYNQIQDVAFENGVLTFSFTHEDDESFELDYIKQIELSENGTLTLTHSTLDPETGFAKKDVYTNKIKWVTNVQFDTGEFPTVPRYEQEVDSQGNPVYDINGMPVYRTDSQGNYIQETDSEGNPIFDVGPWTPNPNATGSFKVLFNNNTQNQWYIPFVDSMTYEQATGLLKYHILGPDRGSTNSLIRLKFIKEILQHDQTGKIIIVYNTLREGAGTSSDPIDSDEYLEGLDDLKQEISDREYQVFPMRALSEIKIQDGKIYPIYTDGAEGEKVNFHTVNEFGYDPDTAVLSYTVDGVNHSFNIDYPKTIQYDISDDKVKYIPATGGNAKEIGTLPLLKDIDLSDDLDLYVRMNGQTGYDLITKPGFQNDTDHKTSDYWVNLGHLAKTLPIMGIAKNYNRQELLEELNSERLVNVTSLNTLRGIMGDTQYSQQKIDSVITCLNLIYPTGQIPEADVQRFRLITVGQDEDLKDFFAFDQFRTKSTYNIIPDSALSEEGVISQIFSQPGSWYFLGRIQTSKNVAVGDSTAEVPSSGGILLTKKSDIYSITYDSVNPFSVKNKMKEIKHGSVYKNKIFSGIPVTPVIMMGNEDITASCYNTTTQEILINEVTGDISITRQ